VSRKRTRRARCRECGALRAIVADDSSLSRFGITLARHQAGPSRTKFRDVANSRSLLKPDASSMSNPPTVVPSATGIWPARAVQCAAGLIVAAALINLASLKLVADSRAALDLADTVFDLVVGCAMLTLTFTGIFRGLATDRVDWKRADRRRRWCDRGAARRDHHVPDHHHGDDDGIGRAVSLVRPLAGLVQHVLRGVVVGDISGRGTARRQ
jgi:hypothetical protein